MRAKGAYHKCGIVYFPILPFAEGETAQLLSGVAKRLHIKVVGFVKSLLRLKETGHDVSAVEVACSATDGKTEVLDFVDATVYSILAVEPTSLIDEFYRRRVACVRAAWTACSDEIT